MLLLITLATIYPNDITIFTLSANMITVGLPDIDHMNSKVGHKHKITSWFVSKFGHRTITHSLVGLGLIVFIFAIIQDQTGFRGLVDGVFIGYGSHILADMSTTKGVQLFWPLPLKVRIPIIWRFPSVTQILWILFFLYLIAKSHNLSSILNQMFK